MIVICGPTSVGKTGIALKLCKEFGMQIISADSRQIYKEFDVGTGKVPISTKQRVDEPCHPELVSVSPLEPVKKYEKEMLKQVQHDKKEDTSIPYLIDGAKIYGYDVVNPHEIYSAGKFAIDAKKYESEIKANKSIPIVVGGTGLYIDALLYGFDQESPVDWKLRESLEKLTLSELQEKLPTHILKLMNHSDVNNKRRLIRRIEFLSSSANQKEVNFNDSDNTIIFLKSSNEFLFSKVDMWVDAVWQDLLIETAKLLQKGYVDTIPMKGLIYKTVAQYLANDFEDSSKSLQKEQVKQRVKFDLHAYIRRQLTWFKKYHNAQIIDVLEENPYNIARNIVASKLKDAR